MAMKTVSRAELARVLGLSPGRITQLISTGLPVRPDGKINRAEAIRWYQKRFSGGPIKPGPKTNPATDDDFMAARTRKERALAELREMEAARKRGELVRLTDVRDMGAHMVTTVRSRLLAMPAKLAPIVAVNSDPAQCQEIIRAEVYEALNELSQMEF